MNGGRVQAMRRAERWAQSISGALCASALLTGVAWAGDCNSDIATLNNKRQGFMEKLNVIAKATKGKLDPVASCPVLRSLVKAETDLLGYLSSNKNWCNVPDEAVDNLKKADLKTQGFATQACNIAEQVKKQKQQAASNTNLGVEAQKLPAGPL
jgi:hypothetical protein